MIQPILSASVFLLNNAIEKEPGAIIGPITKVLGFILNGIFNMVFSVTQAHSLGITIVFFTIVIRLLMMPLAFKSQKSMTKMQEIQPELDKIKKKYEKDKSQQGQQKMNAEMQALLSKNGVNQLAGCLPMFIQLPIFFALMYLMRTSYLFITKLGDIYWDLADKIMQAPDHMAAIANSAALIFENSAKSIKDLQILDTHADIMRVLNKFTTANWYGGTVKEKTGLFSSVQTQVTGLLEQLPAENVMEIEAVLMQKQSVEQFFGINLVEASGLGFPGILIPILCAVTTFLSSWIMMRNSKGNDQAAQMQKSMMFMMPIMMGVMTVGISAGVGIYWITGSVFQVFQSILLNRHFRKKEVAE